VLICIFSVLAVIAAQGFDFFGGYPSFGAGPRDSRANRGPVVFPMTLPGAESSGVRVGASGYGFVPPGLRGGTSNLRTVYYNFQAIKIINSRQRRSSRNVFVFCTTELISPPADAVTHSHMQISP
ncbi:hypothetical protein AAG570_006834, partial [Ranatra chinensis]